MCADNVRLIEVDYRVDGGWEGNKPDMFVFNKYKKK